MPRLPILLALPIVLAGAFVAMTTTPGSAGGPQILGQYDIHRLQRLVPEADLSALTISQQARLHLLVSDELFTPNHIYRERIRAILRRP